jgi:death on curing protein
MGAGDFRKESGVAAATCPMTDPAEVRFLTLELVMKLHGRSLAEHGGIDGVRDPGAVESALAAAQNVWLYTGGDLYEVASTYAYHLAEAQAFLDGNKRTAIVSALFFLAANGVVGVPNQDEAFDAMIDVAAGRLDRAGLANFLRRQFPPR